MATPLHFLSTLFRGNQSSAFEATHGMTVWNYLEQHPEFGKTIYDAMANDTRLSMSVIVNEGKAVFENLKSLVDVGGCTGVANHTISEAFPHLKCTAKDNEMMQVNSDVWKYTLSLIRSMSLKCAIELGIPEIIHNHGKPMTLSSLVDNLAVPPTKADSLNRLMRFLIHGGFFAKEKLDENQEDEGFVITQSSMFLVKDNKNTLSSIVLAMVDPVMVTPLHFFSTLFRGNESSAFEAVHGMTFWNYLEQHPEFGKTIYDAMANDSRLSMSVIVNEGKAVFENLKSLVDVGGCTGVATQTISEAFPHLKCTVLDLPHVVAGLPNSKNLDFVGGDMFESIPRSNAVLLKFVLLDWNDNDCVKILKNCKEAIPSREEGGKVIIIDAVVEDRIQEHERTETQLLLDILAMVQVGGKERTEKEWEKLFLESGFVDYKITPFAGFRSLIEVYP